jgi:hypothetical protein
LFKLAAARQAKAPPALRCRGAAAAAASQGTAAARKGAACRFLAAGDPWIIRGQTFATVSILHAEENKRESDHSDAHKKQAASGGELSELLSLVSRFFFPLIEIRSIGFFTNKSEASACP